MKQNKQAVATEVVRQSWLRPELTPVGPNKDYEVFRGQLEALDKVLLGSHLEAMAMDFALQGHEHVTVGQRQQRLRVGLKALRLELLRTIEGIKGVSKSELERASKCFNAQQVRWMGPVLIEMVAEADRATELGLTEAQPMETCLVDSTCLPSGPPVSAAGASASRSRPPPDRFPCRAVVPRGACAST